VWRVSGRSVVVIVLVLVCLYFVSTLLAWVRVSYPPRACRIAVPSLGFALSLSLSLFSLNRNGFLNAHVFCSIQKAIIIFHVEVAWARALMVGRPQAVKCVAAERGEVQSATSGGWEWKRPGWVWNLKAFWVLCANWGVSS